MINHSAAISNVASHCNMICSADVAKSQKMKLPDISTAGARLQWARVNAGYRQAGDFADRAGIKHVTYRAYENDQNGFAKNAALFANLLAVDLQWLWRYYT